MTDREALAELSIVEICCEILLGVLRSIPIKEQYDQAKYEKEIIKKLKFQSHKDVLLLRACIDSMEDTQFAIVEVFQNGLGGHSSSLGEKYLRLYGVLNAYYQQMFSLFSLNRLFHGTNQMEVKQRFKALKIIKLRNQIGAHTLNYVEDFGNKREEDFFKVVQTSLSWPERLHIVGHVHKWEEINLYAVMQEFTTELEKALYEICAQAVAAFCLGDNDLRTWLLYRVEYVSQRITLRNNSSNNETE